MDEGGWQKARKVVIGFMWTLSLSLPGPLVFLSGSWVQVKGGHILGREIAVWPHSVVIRLTYVFFSEYFALVTWF